MSVLRLLGFRLWLQLQPVFKGSGDGGGRAGLSQIWALAGCEAAIRQSGSIVLFYRVAGSIWLFQNSTDGMIEQEL